MKIGFIGLGIMGESMCENIVKKHDDTVYANDHKQSQIAQFPRAEVIQRQHNRNIEIKEYIAGKQHCSSPFLLNRVGLFPPCKF